jgi:alginate O-acetyltransferase complex protein AlgI
MFFKFGNPLRELKAINIGKMQLGFSLFFIAVLVLIEWVNREKEHALQIEIKSNVLKYGVYYAFTFFILYYFNENSIRPFIYFQF